MQYSGHSGTKAGSAQEAWCGQLQEKKQEKSALLGRHAGLVQTAYFRVCIVQVMLQLAPPGLCLTGG